ncbi:Dihydrolipoamide dehydrogenase [Reticulomyxa filosa]|uniref:Dihydrolipoamide dehydrogenase n=1 Tax=Reticulomyxa filosa TaxID=46433 RepID=X6MT63_RETFI|nr:Dihydrolipoamide dehydrogenase [Reticulomyxa filosa]|eukprot:ETO16295.1 Dihydrolipoamide dehydrogenase [Reticulomyxa filosa]
MNEFPTSMLVYGGGVIGCEFATIFSNYGVVKPVYLFNEYRDRLLPQEDEDLSSFLTDNLESANVSVMNRVVMRDISLIPNANANTNSNSKYQVKCVYDVIRFKHPNVPIKHG